MASARFVFRGLVLWLGVLAAVAAVAAHGGRFSSHLDVLTHFAPFYLAGGALVLVVALFSSMAQGKLALAVTGGVAAIASLGLVVPELTRPMTPPAPAGAPAQIKLVQFNAGERDGAIAEQVRWLAAQAPDVLVMEETTGPLREAVSRSLGLRMTCGRTCDVAIFTKAMPEKVERPRRGRYGLGPPIVVLHMPQAEGGYIVVGTHYAWPIRVREYRENTARMAFVLHPLAKDRMILAGDFNSTPWSFARRREDVDLGLERRDRALASWPAGAAFLPIDHIYAGRAWRTVSLERGPKIGSDHHPLIAVLALAPTP